MGDSYEQSNALQHCGNCKEMNVQVQEFMQLKEYIESRKNTTCEVCRKKIENALKEINSTSEDSSCDTSKAVPVGSSLPIQISKEDQSPDYQVGDSIALMESSRRLLDFMNLHKTRINQLKQEKESKQKKLNTKLSEFSTMCQMIRCEISQTRDEFVSKSAYNMILQLEEEIKSLQAQHVGINDPEPQGCIIHQGAELFVPGCESMAESMIEKSSKINYVRNISDDNLNSDESDVTSYLSDSDTSHASHELVFSLDDEF